MTKAQPRRAAGTPSGGQWAASYHDEPDIDLKDHTKRRAVVAAAAVLPFALSAPSAAAQAPPGPPVWQSALGAIATARATKLGWLAPVTSGKVTYHIETAPKWTSPQWLAVPQAHGGVVVVADNRPFMPVQTTITGLQPGHTYIFQIVGVQDGSQFGSIGPISVAINPTSNSTWPQPSPCSTHPPMTPPALKCADQTYLAEIDQARRAEGLGPMVLPTDYPHLPAPEQILVVTNSERGSRGLPTFAGLTARLNYYAEAGARAHEDPSDPTSAWASNWAGTSDPLEADFLWMYYDGPGGTNLDCTTPAAGGCWRHRQDILGDYGPHPEMGAAVYGTGSATQLFEPGPAA